MFQFACRLKLWVAPFSHRHASPAFPRLLTIVCFALISGRFLSIAFRIRNWGYFVHNGKGSWLNIHISAGLFITESIVNASSSFVRTSLVIFRSAAFVFSFCHVSIMTCPLSLNSFFDYSSRGLIGQIFALCVGQAEILSLFFLMKNNFYHLLSLLGILKIICIFKS